MSLNVALSSAVSSLLATETQMTTASNNISNADTVGYTKKTVKISANVLGGEACGVITDGVVSTVNEYLSKEIVSANSSSNYASSYESYYDDLQNSLGQITSSSSGGNDLSSEISSLSSAVSTLAGTPSDTATKTTIVNDLNQVTATLNDTAQTVQKLRSTADQDISTAVDQVNAALNTINDLNTQIRTAKARGDSTADLEDQQRTALNTVSNYLDVRYYTSSNGSMNVMTAGGTYLVDNDNVHTLSHTAKTLSAGQSYVGPYQNTVKPSSVVGNNVDGIWVGGTDITAQISSGKIGAAIDMRDNELTSVQSSLDNLATQLAKTVNGVYSQTAVTTAGSSLTSSQTLSSPVSVGADSTIRVCEVDSSGNAVTGAVDLKVNQGGTGNVSFSSPAALLQDIASENSANATYDSGTNTLTVTDGSGNVVGTMAYDDTTGKLSLTANDSTSGMAVTTLDGSSFNGTTFGAYAHLDDMLSVADPQTTVSSSTSASPTSGLTVASGTRIQIQLQPASGTGTTVNVDIPTTCTTSTQIAATISAALAASSDQTTQAITCTESGGTFSISSNNANYAVSVKQVSGAINGNSFMTYAHLNQTQVSSAATISVNSDLVTNPSDMRTTGLTTASTTPSLGSAVIAGSGDTTIMSSLATALNSSQSFVAAGHLGSQTVSVKSYAGNLITDVATNASLATSQASAASSSLSTLQSNFSNQSGVNINEETANLVQLQSSYAAAAKVISTVQSMYQDLMQAVGG